MTTIRYPHEGSFLQSVRTYHIECPPVWAFVAWVYLQDCALLKTICSLISFAKLEDGLPPVLLVYAASITGINFIATVFGIMTLLVIAVDENLSFLGAITAVLVLAPSILVSAVLQSVLTWRERAVILTTCIDSASFERGVIYPLPWIGFSANTTIHAPIAAREWCEAEWESNWTTSLLVIMITLLGVVISARISLGYLLQLRRLVSSQNPTQFIETCRKDDDPDEFTFSDKEKGFIPAIFFTVILSLTRAALTLDPISSVMGHYPTLVGYITAVNTFVACVEGIGFIAPSKDLFRIKAVLALITFPCVILSTTVYIFSIWWEKEILLSACVTSHGLDSVVNAEVEQLCRVSWRDLWRMEILWGIIWICIVATSTLQLVRYDLNGGAHGQVNANDRHNLQAPQRTCPATRNIGSGYVHSKKKRGTKDVKVDLDTTQSAHSQTFEERLQCWTMEDGEFKSKSIVLPRLRKWGGSL